MPYKDLEERREYDRVRKHAHREELKPKKHAYYLATRAKRKAHTRAYNVAYSQTHKQERKAYHQGYKQALTAEALRVLGNKCSCPGCDESEPLFLTIDHINGRVQGSRSRKAILDAKASGWDKTKFQILCFNCNCAKHDRGFCPVHQTIPEGTNGHNPAGHPQLSLLPLLGRTI